MFLKFVMAAKVLKVAKAVEKTKQIISKLLVISSNICSESLQMLMMSNCRKLLQIARIVNAETITVFPPNHSPSKLISFPRKMERCL